MAKKHKTLSDLIATRNKTKKLDGLPTDLQIVFDFLVLVVDIQYRNKHGSTIKDQKGVGYERPRTSDNY